MHMAIQKSSRYRDVQFFSLSEDQYETFPGVRPREIGAATAVLEHVVQEGERLDLLALHYYNDSRRWWRIVDANPDIIFGNDLVVKGKEGSIILIPRSTEPGGA